MFFLEPGRLEWRDTPAPVIQAPGDALVRPTVMTTCDIDPLIIAGRTPLKGPFPLGHEAIGEVVAVGSEVTALKIGQRVALTYYDSCGHCRRCGAQAPNRCETIPRRWHGVGLTEVGFFSDLVRVPNADESLFALPEHLDPVHLASLGDNIGFAHEFVVPHLKRTPGAPVLIMGGCGSIALYAAAFAVASGATRVDYVDDDPERCEIAERFGAKVHLGAAPKRMGQYPITIDASARGESLLCAIRSTEPEGFCNSVGGHYGVTGLPLFEMYQQGIHFYTGPGRGRPNMAEALALIVSAKIDLSLVTSGVFALAEAATVLLRPRIKPVFVPH